LAESPQLHPRESLAGFGFSGLALASLASLAAAAFDRRKQRAGLVVFSTLSYLQRGAVREEVQWAPKCLHLTSASSL
jgi:hypothetical protein